MPVPPVLVTLVTGPNRALRAEAAALVADRVGECRTSDGSGIDIDALVARIEDAVPDATPQSAPVTLALGIGDVHDPADVGFALHAALSAREPSERPLHVRDVIAVVRGDELDRLLHPGRDRGDGTSAQAIANRVEFATAVIVVGYAPPRAADLAYALNPRAPILLVDRPASVGAYRFRRLIRPPVDDLASEQGWMLALSDRAPRLPRGVDSVVFRDPRPFHPGRLDEVVRVCLTPQHAGTIWRSRGVVRLASRAGAVGSWSSAGAHLNLDPTGLTDDEPDIISGQEIVFVGERLRGEEITRALGAALLADDELIAGPMEWASYVDPFPAWHRGHAH